MESPAGTSSATKAAVATVLLLRVAYGVALVVAPDRLAQRWLGSASKRAPTQVALRGLGARDALLHVGGLIALARNRPLRPWLAASILGDLSDVSATIEGRGGLPRISPPATVLVGGGAAAISAALAGAVER